MCYLMIDFRLFGEFEYYLYLLIYVYKIAINHKVYK